MLRARKLEHSPLRSHQLAQVHGPQPQLGQLEQQLVLREAGVDLRMYQD